MNVAGTAPGRAVVDAPGLEPLADTTGNPCRYIQGQQEQQRIYRPHPIRHSSDARQTLLGRGRYGYRLL